jgi:hypothetical protein
MEVTFQCVRTDGGLVTLSGPNINLGLNSEKINEALRLAQQKVKELGLLNSNAVQTSIAITVELKED